MFNEKDKNHAALFLVLLNICTFAVFAQAQQPGRQTYTVRGEILSLVDGLPLANIRVYLKGTDYNAVSDSAGVFVIKGVPTGTYDVIAKYPDFDATILKDVIVPPPARKSFVFNLEPAEKATPLPYF
ncbi:MAG: carboxypeptidase-like regulatory domain-containing protein, partial [bacterium]